ncbi:TIGR01212 family radical SAM protein [Bacteroidia bacterium]|nr:TIGR01212 family radical SAM protein [Bacteroidia bacterium]
MTYPWGDDRPFNSYSGYFARTFGGRMQKVAINAALTCPNRDGTVGHGGCTFCRNDAFTPSYCSPAKSITRQIDEGIEFHRRRYARAEGYLAYFQSFSNTYAPVETLEALFGEALAHPQIAGMVVGTRPDTVDSRKLDMLAALARKKYIAVEYGIESCNDMTLMAINRGHDFACARRAVEQTASRGVHTGAHFILGLPGETPQQLIDQTDTINILPLHSIKFHQLQIFRDTPMERDWTEHPERYPHWTLDDYLDLCVEIVRRLRSDIIVERIAGEAPPRFLAHSQWGLVRNEQLLARFEQRLRERHAFQGDLCR